MRFGLQWGATLYVGQIAPAARAEVAAPEEEVNEARESRRAPPADVRSEQAKALEARVSELAVLGDSEPLECISTADLDAIRRKVRAPLDNGEPMRVKAILQELTEEVRIDAATRSNRPS